MASRKEQKEALRREREAREQAARDAQRRKRLVGYGAAGLLGVAVVVVLVVLALSGGGDGDGGEATANVFPDGGKVPDTKTDDLRAASKAAGCTLKTVKGKPGEHTQDPNERVKYNSNPPTTGKHYVEPAADQAYQDAPSDEQLVHSEEHGRVLIWVKPSLPKDDRANLKALYDEDTYQVIIVPRTNMPYAVAASAWNADPPPNGAGRIMGCERYNERIFDALRSFIGEHRGNGPEAVP